MTNRRELRHAAVAGLLLALACVIGGRPAAIEATAARVQPISIAADASRGILILDRVGALRYFEPASGRVRTIVDELDGFWPIDMTLATHDGRPAIYVTQFRRVSDTASVLRLVRFTGEGTQTGKWFSVGSSSDLLAGVGVLDDVVYLVGKGPNEISRLNLRRAKPVRKHLVGLRGAVRTGPLALDRRSGAIFVGDAGDPGRGAVYRTDVDASTVTRIEGDVSQPTALAVDPSRERLLILDGLQGVVRTLELKADRLDPSPLIRLERWSEPLGLTVARDGTIWIGDPGRGTLTRASPDGRVTEVFELGRSD